MSATTPFLIADFKSGLQSDLQPWILPRDAFPKLENAYLYRGVIRKRGGSELLSGAPTDEASINKSRIRDNTATSTYLTGPILGLLQREISSINSEQLIAWGSDRPVTTAHPNVFSNSAGEFQENTAAPSWTADAETYFWGKNYFRSLWVTTNNPNNPIRYTFDPTRTAFPPWIDFSPEVTNGNFLTHALLIIPFKNRLIFLNTTEDGINYRQRARWSQNGNPYISTNSNDIPNGVVTPTTTTAWRSDIVGKGGFIDAPTGESIVTAEFFKDQLIVFFERSTWQLRYTGNPILPFVWDRLNSERGAESTWSNVRLENGSSAVSFNGIVISDGVNAERLDWKIPDLVYSFGNEDSITKVTGIRDFYAEAVYWAYVSQEANNIDASDLPNYADSVLYYNYRENTWAIFNISLTVFTHFTTFEDRTWGDETSQKQTWGEAQFPWVSPGLIKDFPIVVAGTPEGFVIRLSLGGQEHINQTEAITLTGSSTSGTVTSPSHNLKEGQFVQVYDPSMGVQDYGDIFRVDNTSRDTFDCTFPSQIPDFNPIFLRVVPNFDITTKRLNPVIEKGKVGRLIYLDTYIQNVESGTNDQFTSNLLIDNNVNTAVNTIQVDATTNEDKVWKRIFFNSTGNFFTVKFNFSENQMIDADISLNDVRIHGMMFHMREAGGRLTR